MILDCASLTIKDHFCSLLISNIIFVFLTFFHISSKKIFFRRIHGLRFLFALSEFSRFRFSSLYTTTIDKKLKNLNFRFSLDCTSFVILL